MFYEAHKMIDFEEEIKKFYPSLEIEEFEDSFNGADLTDAVDLYVRMGKKAASDQQAQIQQMQQQFRDQRPGRRY